ncbi:hypothetical protein CW745_12505 [Psychromonas sp. psych-6C06]|uniref:hypothetical protein n=1 Tax=Psychromonas sp. psych-6C06 TaxID=2058089 RepID=UPI000C3270CF|nr:hypothetical protein [Psychromonas sp. psych-6C06]PKF61119.1 hypothetical protein CW745_12505 [Psychromonas sp. psych-6C06]
MNQEFDTFIQQSINNPEQLCEDLLLQAGFDFLKVQLQAYLDKEGVTALTFTQAIKVARKLNHHETDARFWSALEAFYLAVGDSIDNDTKRKRWLRFVNIIEELQGYTGSQLINDKRLRNKRVKRLYLAFTLGWEHLRYIAGNEDDYNPSELVLATFTDAFDHDHD